MQSSFLPWTEFPSENPVGKEEILGIGENLTTVVCVKNVGILVGKEVSKVSIRVSVNAVLRVVGEDWNVVLRVVKGGGREPPPPYVNIQHPVGLSSREQQTELPVIYSVSFILHEDTCVRLTQMDSRPYPRYSSKRCQDSSFGHIHDYWCNETPYEIKEINILTCSAGKTSHGHSRIHRDTLTRKGQ